MDRYRPGQRWTSEAEPELGMGILLDVAGRSVRIYFPAASETRRYAASSAPLRRARFEPGDTVGTQDGTPFEVEHVREFDGLLTYEGGGRQACETDLLDTAEAGRPDARLLTGHVDEGTVVCLSVGSGGHLSPPQ